MPWTTRRFRHFGLLVLMALWLAPLSVAARDEGCEANWEDESGYSVICNTWPEPAVCWDEWQIEEACWDWCWNYNGQQWDAQDWGCNYEGLYQMEIWCGCSERP